MLTQTRIDAQIEKADAERETLQNSLNRLIKARDRELEKVTRLASEIRHRTNAMSLFLDPRVPEAAKPRHTFAALQSRFRSDTETFLAACTVVNSCTKGIDTGQTHIDRVSARIIDLEKKRNKAAV